MLSLLFWEEVTIAVATCEGLLDLVDPHLRLRF